MINFLKKALKEKQKLQTQTESFKQYQGSEFWYWEIDPTAHETAYVNTGGKCCFNHQIGLPFKNGVRHPIYSWQKEIYDALTHHKLIAILKARGIGASEYLLR